MTMHRESERAQGRRGGAWPWSRKPAPSDEPEYLSYGPLYDEDGPGDGRRMSLEDDDLVLAGAGGAVAARPHPGDAVLGGASQRRGGGRGG